MYSRCLLLSLPAAPLTFAPHNKRAPLNALYGVKVGVLESCHLIGFEDFAIPQSRRTTSRRQEVEAFTSKVDHTINRAIPSCVQHCMADCYHVIAMLNRVHFWCSGKILQTCLEIAKTEVSKATKPGIRLPHYSLSVGVHV